MPQIRKPANAVARFAHFLGMGAAAAVESEDENDDEKDVAEDDEKEQSKKAKKADSDRDDADVEGDDDDDMDGDDKEQSKKAKRAEADDEGEKAAATRAGARAERKRWAGVLSQADITGARLAVACQLLSETDNTVEQVLAAARAAPAGKSAGLYDAMAGVKTPNPGSTTPKSAGGAVTTPEQMAKSIAAAAAKARGKTAA